MIEIDNLIKEALKTKNETELRVYRNLKAKILEFKTAKNAKPYNDEEEIKLISKECRKLEDAILEFSKADRQDLVLEYTYELEVLKKLLPEPVKSSDVMIKLWEWAGENNLLVQVDENPNNFSVPKIPKKEMGIAIKHLKSKFPAADGKMISEIVKKYIK